MVHYIKGANQRVSDAERRSLVKDQTKEENESLELGNIPAITNGVGIKHQPIS